MVEFKGTKGKWIVCINYNDIVLTDAGAYRPNSMQTVNSTKNELKANALLISKAPEMLEMLEIILQSENTPIVHRKKVKQLIKEATEL